MVDINLHIDDCLELSYLKENIDTDNVSISSSKPYEEYEVQNKKYIFDPQNIGEYTIEYNNQSITIKVYDMPQTVIGHYDFRLEDGSMPVTDQSTYGNDLDTGGYTDVSRTINGYQAGNFVRSSDDYIEMSSELSKSYNMPIVIYLVMAIDNIQNSEIINNSNIHMDISNGNEMFIWPSSYIRNYFPNTSTHIYTMVWDGSNSYVNVDGNQVMSGTIDSSAHMDTINFNRPGGNGPVDAKLGLMEVHKNLPYSGNVSKRENEIANDWEITI